MSKSKKKHNHTLKEAQRAQMAVDRPTAQNYKPNNNPGVETKPAPNMASTLAVKKSLELPIKEIKHDLVKNIAFAVVSIGVLIVLSYTHFGYAQLSGLFKI